MRTLYIKNDLCNYIFTFELKDDKAYYKLYEDDKVIISAVDNEDEYEWYDKRDITQYYGFADMLLFMQCVKICDNKLMGTYEIFETNKLMDL